MNQAPALSVSSVKDRIHAIKRRFLDQAVAPLDPPLWGRIEAVPFVRLLGLGAYWRGEEAADDRMEQVLLGLHGLNLPLHYLIIAEPHETGVFVGLPEEQSSETLSSILRGFLPDVEIAEGPATLGRTMNAANLFRERARVTGVPASLSGDEAGPRKPSASRTTLDALLAGMWGETWGLFVRALPVSQRYLATQIDSLLSEAATVSSGARRQRQEVTQTMTQVDPRTSQGSTVSMSGDLVNRHAEYLSELLECQLERYRRAFSSGAWDTEVHLFSGSATALRRLETLVRAALGHESAAEPVRTEQCAASSRSPADDFNTILTSRELGAICSHPRTEVLGFRISDYAEFDVHPPKVDDPSPVTIGNIVSHGRPTQVAYRIPRESLTKHGLISGVTGSGKTSLMLSLLTSVWSKGAGTPFLIIEPAKTEYRFLKGKPDSNGRWKGLVPNLRVYTLGDETALPFRINPFEFELGSAGQRTHVQTHIDLLKWTFNAAFPLYAPMPYVLETALHEVYQDRGWDLTTGENRRLDRVKAIDRRLPIFPVLEDLYDKVETVTDRLGYDDRIRMDVKAGLRARIGSLLVGSKRTMLNVRTGDSIKELLAAPTVLELERIGNDDEKAFIIGLILSRLYEFRRLHKSQFSGGLLHLTVIEEAHRLLKNVPTEVGLEGASAKAQAVESFANLLAEVRAYGEGFLVVEQIPTKIAPDAIKNSSLKVVLRTVAEDDRRLLAGSTNMTEEQQRVVASLEAGKAVVFAEGADHPYLLQVHSVRQASAGVATDLELRKFAAYEHDGALLSTNLGALEIRRELRQDQRVAGQLDQIIFGLSFDWRLARSAAADLARRSVGTARALGVQVSRERAADVAIDLLAEAFDRRGRLYMWPFRDQNALVEEAGRLARLAISGADEPGSGRTRFADSYAKLTNREPDELPFTGCVACPTPCRYRPEGRRIADDKFFQHDVDDSLARATSDEELADSLLVAGRTAIQSFGSIDAGEAARDGLALCALVQVASSMGARQATQVRVAAILSTRLRKERTVQLG